MLAGGTLALLAQNGAAVHYLCATRGEGGEVGEPPLCTQEQLGEVREKELACAVRSLGGRSLTFLGYVDPRVGPQDTLFAYSDNLNVLAGQVTASIRQFDAQVVISHGSNGEYGHPAHLLTYQAARLAVESLGESGPGFYTTAAIFPDHPRPRIGQPGRPRRFDPGRVISPASENAGRSLSPHPARLIRPSRLLKRPDAG